MTFKTMAYVMTAAGILLGVRMIVAGASLLHEWGLEVTPGSLLICRRLGALYLGIAVLFFLGRTASASDLRSAVCLGVAGTIALLACLGGFEFWAGRVGPRIFISILSETVLAAGFVWAWWSGR